MEDFEERLRGVVWGETPNDVIPTLPTDIQRYIAHSLMLSQIDFRYWAQRYCKIQSAAKDLITLRDFWPGQEKLLQILAENEEQEFTREGHAKIRVLVLKARQLGQTAICEALLAHMAFFFHRTQAVVASDHPDSTIKLFNTIVRIYDNLPEWMKPMRDAKTKGQNLHFSTLDSDIQYGSGNQKTSLGQGMTVDAAHITEVSTWIYPQYIDADLLPAFDSSRKHHSLAIFESTAFGADGWFHDHYRASLTGKSVFHSVFIPWYARPDRIINPAGITLESETLALAERIKREEGVELTKGQLAWYQRERAHYASTDDLETFLQEAPSCVQDAFQIIGMKCAFPPEVRSRARDECKLPLDVYDVDPKTAKFKRIPIEEWLLLPEAERFKGKYLVWERVAAGAAYAIGVDASYGKADNGVIEVLRVGTKRSSDEQVAEFAGVVDPLELAGLAWKIGHQFADKKDNYPAEIAVEINGPGISTELELQRRGYRNLYIWRRPLRMDGRRSREFGWETNRRTRGIITENLVGGIKKGDLLVNSIAFVEEMGWFVNTADPRTTQKFWEHAPGKHDDRIFALAIAYEAAHGDDLSNLAEARRKREELKAAPPAAMEQLWARAENPEDAMRHWEERVFEGLDISPGAW